MQSEDYSFVVVGVVGRFRFNGQVIFSIFVQRQFIDYISHDIVAGMSKFLINL